MTLSNNIRMEDTDVSLLEDEYQCFVEDIGLDAFLQLIQTRGGGFIYIPLMKKVLQPIIVNLAIKDYSNGMPIPKIARKYNVSAAFIRSSTEKRRNNK